MNKLEQAARQALDFIDYFVFNGDNAAKAKSISTALREALSEQAEGVIVKTCPDGYGTITTEQAEQEQVCIDWDTKTDEPIMGYAAPLAKQDTHATHVVRTKDLTEQEIQDAIINISPTGTGYFLRIARAVIAAYKEKNK